MSEKVKVSFQASDGGGCITYLVYGIETKKAALIDAGKQTNRLIDCIEEEALDVKFIFVTHCHTDHLDGIGTFQALYPNAILIKYNNNFVSGNSDFIAQDGKDFSVGSFNIKSIHTPGHSPDSMSYYTENILFSGDALRDDSLRSFIEARKSARKICDMLPETTIIYPGHRKGEVGTIIDHSTDIGCLRKKLAMIWSSDT